VTAPGSTLGVDCRPTIAVDPGSRWTAIVVRVGAAAVDGALVGVTGVDGQPLDAAARKALDLLDDHATRQRYIARVIRCALELRERHSADALAAGGFMVAVEAESQPATHLVRQRRRVRREHWIVPLILGDPCSPCSGAACSCRRTATAAATRPSAAGRATPPTSCPIWSRRK
jgi:hypothetical protein